MRKKDYDIAQQFKNRLSKLVPRIDLRVFGSRAREENDEYSDMDVFIEVEWLNTHLKNSILDTAWAVGFEHCLVISPLIFTRNELENTPLRSSPIVKVIGQEGVVI